MWQDLNTGHSKMLLIWSHYKRQQKRHRRSALACAHGRLDHTRLREQYCDKAHGDTAMRRTHATEQKEMTAACEATPEERLRGCTDKGDRAQLRGHITHAHSQRHAVPRIRQARRRLSAFSNSHEARNVEGVTLTAMLAVTSPAVTQRRRRIRMGCVRSARLRRAQVYLDKCHVFAVSPVENPGCGRLWIQDFRLSGHLKCEPNGHQY